MSENNSNENNANAIDNGLSLTNIAANASSKYELVMQAFREVVDPEIGMDVIALGLIRELDLQADHAHVRMILTTPFCPYGPQLLEQTRRAAQDASGVPTTIELSPEMWDPSMMEEGAGQDWGLFY